MNELIDNPKHSKIKKYLSLIILIIVFITPLILFPIRPSSDWHYKIYRYLIDQMHITIGLSGPLPFFTMLTSVYATVVISLLFCFFFIFFIKKHGVGKTYQENIYKLFFQAEFESSKKFPWLEKPLIKKSIVSSMFILCFILGVFHFTVDDISYASGRRGALIGFSYNYRIGVIFWELIISMFHVFPIIYFGFLYIYIFNYVFRGLGTGKIVIPVRKVSKVKKGKKKSKRRKKGKIA